MNAFLALGRWLFVLPFVLFGLFHFTDNQAFAENVVPSYMPAKEVWVYLAGAVMLAASVLMLIGKYDKVAAITLAVMLLMFVFMVYLPNTLNEVTRQAALNRLLVNISLAGAALMFAQYVAEDKAVVG